MRPRTEIEDARGAAAIDGDPARLVLLMDREGAIPQAPDSVGTVLEKLGLASRHDPRRLVPRSELASAEVVEIHAVLAVEGEVAIEV